MHRRTPLLLTLVLLQFYLSSCQVSVESTHECYEEHPSYSDQRLCLFKNLLVYNNSLYYVSASNITLPQVLISWERDYEGDQLLRINVVKPDELGVVIDEVTEVEEAGLFHQQQAVNFYHLFTEITPTVHYVLCKYLNRCQYKKQDNLRLYWVQYKDPSLDSSLKYRLPPSIQELFRCITPHPVKNIYDVTVEEGQALLLKKAVVGLPRHVRFYHQKRPEWMERFHDPPPAEYMHSFRTRVAECMGYDFVNAVAPVDPVRITFVNRHYEDGRHILNADRLKRQIMRMPAVQARLGNVEVDVVYLEGTLREQAEVMWNTSIYMWPHGASMAHVFFLPKGAQALEIVQWVVEDPTDQHIWVQGIRKAFSLQLGLDVLVNNDRTKVFFKPDVIMRPGSRWYTFNETEKRMLVEDWKCPTWRTEERGISGKECFGWFHWGMTLLLDFDLLRPKVEVALENLAQAVGALDGTAA